MGHDDLLVRFLRVSVSLSDLEAKSWHRELTAQTVSFTVKPWELEGLTLDMDQLGKICWHRWKERLEISKTAKFESDLLKKYKDIAHQGMFGCSTFPPPPLPPYKHTANPLFSPAKGLFNSSPCGGGGGGA